MLAPAFTAAYVPLVSDYPAQIEIPSIALSAPVVPVGINSVGEIAVPDGASNAVGWYQHGAIPGHTGNAIMDAHVFAAFENLRYAKVGDEIRVKDGNGEEQRFVITDSRVYAVSEVPMQELVHGDAGKRLVLITCARKFSRALGTYTHRLVVIAQLVK